MYNIPITEKKCSILTWSYNIEAIMGRSTQILNTTIAPKDEDYNPARKAQWI